MKETFDFISFICTIQREFRKIKRKKNVLV